MLLLLRIRKNTFDLNEGITANQGCELELELKLKELGNFGQTRTRKIKISEFELEFELEKSLWSLSSFNK